MNFSVALTHVKGGQRVYRHGWNGKGMFIHLVPARTIQAGNNAAYKADGGSNKMAELTFLAFINLRTVTGAYVPWLASQTDILAEDWDIMPSGRLAEVPEGPKLVVN